jgi:nucleoside-diphosphate-sugar epimerase
MTTRPHTAPVEAPARTVPAAERELGCTPRVDFEDGLRETVAWFRAAWGR